MNNERAHIGWSFWLWWVSASFVGLAVGFPVAFAVLVAVFGAVGFAVAGGLFYFQMQGREPVWLGNVYS